MRYCVTTLLITLVFILRHCEADKAKYDRIAPSTGVLWPAYPALSYPTPRSKPREATTYAPPFLKLSTLVPNYTTTTWASIESPTDSSIPYGNVAWSSQWQGIKVTAPPFTTTVSATPISSAELVMPTLLPFSLNDENYQFTEGFLYGFAGAALQVEGAIRNEGKGLTISEKTLPFRYSTLKGGGPPDITNLNYYLYKQDIARLAAAGVQSYSFSIPWARILPFSIPGSPVNQQAIDHYDDLINTILEYGMTPIATLNHFDTPIYYVTSTSWQGWDHPEFVEGFLNFAKIVLAHYSDRVGHWISFNEPTTDANNVQNWNSSYNINMAHAKVVHWYREAIKGSGKWSMKFSVKNGMSIPLDPGNPSDVASAQRNLDFAIGHFANPLFLGSQVSTSLSETIGSRAPRYTAAELDYINGTCDFFAVDIYSGSYVTAPAGGIEVCSKDSSHPLFPRCIVAGLSRSGWDIGPTSNNGPILAYQAIRPFLHYLSSAWPSKGGIVVSEFGWPSYEESSMELSQAQVDMAQSIFYLSTLNEILKSIHLDKINVAGAIGWAFVDNWEWGQYDDRYGVQAFNSTTLERSYKRAIFDFVDFVRTYGGE